jgi:hypothetical protein
MFKGHPSDTPFMLLVSAAAFPCCCFPLQLSADDKFGSYMDLTLQLANTQGLIPTVRTSTARSVLANAKAQLLMALQDEDVGAVLGKKGQTLTQIQQVRIYLVTLFGYKHAMPGRSTPVSGFGFGCCIHPSSRHKHTEP